ncbi:MAG: class I SAM-dependent methyltransferase [Vicinamibacterales bacterium]
MNATFYNRTRRSSSIPWSLIRRGRVMELPVYYLLRLSFLAREGLERSGSHRFADHIYRSVPSGQGAIGRWIDARLLGLPAVRSFRSRYVAARDELSAFLITRLQRDRDQTLDILSVPCGIPRELADAAALARAQIGELPSAVRFHGFDLDPVVLDEARDFAERQGLRPFETHLGDALDESAYHGRFDFVTSTGLAEFLHDDELARLYGIFFDVLNPGGRLITSGMQRRRLPDYLLQIAEIHTHYRGPADLERLIARRPFREVRTRRDAVGIQTILTATK